MSLYISPRGGCIFNSPSLKADGFNVGVFTILHQEMQEVFSKCMEQS